MHLESGRLICSKSVSYMIGVSLIAGYQLCLCRLIYEERRIIYNNSMKKSDEDIKPSNLLPRHRCDIPERRTQYQHRLQSGLNDLYSHLTKKRRQNSDLSIQTIKTWRYI